MSVAQEALHYVFKLHAGCLQSYEVDEQKRMLKSFGILLEGEKAHSDFLDTVCAEEEDYYARETTARVEAEILVMNQHVLKRLCRLAPNYVEKSMQSIPQDQATATGMMTVWYDEIASRIRRTQETRIREVLRSIAKFMNSEISESETTEIANHIKRVIPDLIATSYELPIDEQDDDEFIIETYTLIESIITERMNEISARNKKGTKPKRKGKKCKKGRKCVLDKMD